MAAVPRKLLPLSSVLCPLLFLLSLLPCRADLAAPDNILYGIIVLNSNLVTAAQTDVVIEARRGNGVPVARYRMGTRPDAGNFYVLAISVEELAPVRNPVAVLTNEHLSIMVLRSGAVQTAAPFQLAERGQVQRLDFGSIPLNGFEAWALARGLGTGSGNVDTDGDGIVNLQEYVAGTDPNDPNSRFALLVTKGLSGTEISFDTHRADGAGYEGRSRFYFLESAADPQAEEWTGLSGFSNILGANQRMVYAVPGTNASPAFYRGWVELRGP